MWRMIPIILALFLGFWFGQPKKTTKQKELFTEIHPEKDFPVSEHKSFVIVLYAYNDGLWCERALKSIFQQDYDHYRVIVVDDGSIDQTHEKSKDFILKNNQDEKVILIRNQQRLGTVACLYRAVDSCLDREIVIPIEAKNWLSSPLALKRINLAYQNPDVWLTFGKTIYYPSYDIGESKKASFYAGLFKQLRLKDLFQKGLFVDRLESYQSSMIDLSGGRIKKIKDPITFTNKAPPEKSSTQEINVAQYSPLSAFPTKNKENPKADILVFSYDRPLQLYACLESIQRYMTGIEEMHVLYRASSESFKDGYEKVITAFPTVDFVMQSMKDPKQDFKPYVNKIVFDSPSEYILFSVDDLIMKDYVDLKYCMTQMGKTGAYGFYLRMGQHINYCYQSGTSQAVPMSHPLSSGIYAWDISTGEQDWGYANSLDMTLFKKEMLEKPLKELKYKTPNDLECIWAKRFDVIKEIGLYFEVSKLVNIPMNIVGRTGNPHMNYLDADELLAKFNQGLKIDIEPLFQIENSSPHFDYIPEFVMR